MPTALPSLDRAEVNTMSYQYAFCPACGTRRVGYAYRCSVCDGLLRRVPVRVHLKPTAAWLFLAWPANERAEVESPEQPPAAA
jgi:hypothetical protein